MEKGDGYNSQLARREYSAIASCRYRKATRVVSVINFLLSTTLILMNSASYICFVHFIFGRRLFFANFEISNASSKDVIAVTIIYLVLLIALILQVISTTCLFKTTSMHSVKFPTHEHDKLIFLVSKRPE